MRSKGRSQIFTETRKTETKRYLLEIKERIRSLRFQNQQGAKEEITEVSAQEQGYKREARESRKEIQNRAAFTSIINLDFTIYSSF